MLLLTPRHRRVPSQLTFIVLYFVFTLELRAQPNGTTNFGATYAFTFVTACQLVPSALTKVYQWASAIEISSYNCHLTTGFVSPYPGGSLIHGARKTFAGRTILLCHVRMSLS